MRILKPESVKKDTLTCLSLQPFYTQRKVIFPVNMPMMRSQLKPKVTIGKTSFFFNVSLFQLKTNSQYKTTVYNHCQSEITTLRQPVKIMKCISTEKILIIY